MGRRVDSFSMGSSFPAPGKHSVEITAVSKGLSEKKKTPFIKLTMSDGENEFSDDVYCTPRTISRMCLIAMRVCGLDRATEIPDEDKEAIAFLGKYIMENATGKNCIVLIEENEEMYMVEKGPDVGQTKKIKRRRVAMIGYFEYKESKAAQEVERKEPEDVPALEEPVSSELPF